MLIECRECKKSVSDQAASCPHCGCAIKAKKTMLARQLSRFFALLFFGGIVYIFARDTGEPAQPGQIAMTVGMLGWMLAKIWQWFGTDHFR